LVTTGRFRDMNTSGQKMHWNGMGYELEADATTIVRILTLSDKINWELTHNNINTQFNSLAELLRN
jgi:hypothetical protein